MIKLMAQFNSKTLKFFSLCMGSSIFAPIFDKTDKERLDR